jgi:hypothetical protein
MNFIKLLSNLIVEDSKFDALYNKYVEVKDKKNPDVKKKGLPFDMFKKLILADPTTRVPQGFDVEGAKVEDMEAVKVGKYAQWIITTFGKLPTKLVDVEPGTPEYKEQVKELVRLYLEDLDHLKTLLEKYERFKGSLENPEKKDINKVGSVEELMTLPVVISDDGETIELDLYRGKKVKKSKGDDSNEPVDEKFKFPGAEILRDNGEYTLIKIADKGKLGSDAGSYFGGYDGKAEAGETNWCTAAKDSSYSKGYRQDGPLYIFIANDAKGQVGEKTGLPSERYQFHFPSNQFRDRFQKSGNIDVVKFMNGPFADFKDLLKNEFLRVGQKTSGGGEGNYSGSKINITFPSNVSLYEQIYGSDLDLQGKFNAIIEGLPKDMDNLVIKNSSSMDVALDIPETIGNYTNLSNLTLINLVKTLPDSIGNLRELEFLILTDNPSIESIPGSVVNMTDLVFINLQRSNPNVKIPNEVMELFDMDEAEGGFWPLK